MPIPLDPPLPHPCQAGVVLDSLAVDELRLVSGAAIDGPASLAVQFRPYASVVTSGETTAYLSAPVVGGVTMEIPDVYVWVAERAGLGDMKPYAAMNALVEAIGEEYVRRKQLQSSPESPGE